MIRSIQGALVVACVACVGMFGARPAEAQTNARGFTLDRFSPAEAGSDWFAADSLDVRGHNRFALGLLLDYARDPLVIRDGAGNEVVAPVAHQLIGHLGASYVLWDRVRFGASLPVLLVNSGEAGTIGDVRYVAKDAPALGDLRVAGDVALLGSYGEPFRLAAGLQVVLPTGRKSRYTSDGKPRFVPHVLAAGDVGLLSYAAQLAFDGRLRDDTIVDQPLGPALAFAVAAGARLFDGLLLLGPEVQGATSVEGDHAFTGGGSVLELLVGAHVQIGSSWRAGLGAGRDFTNAIGSPSYRLLANLAFVTPYARRRPTVVRAPVAVAPPPPADRDGDGISDIADACPGEPGRASAKAMLNGCPDRDGDEIVDKDDACPTEAGLASDDKAKNGCPVPPDQDHDGVPDKDDACPQLAGLTNEDKAKNGCPPPPDQDHDGVVDSEDACPDLAGEPNSAADKNGCPKVRLVAGEIQILDRIEFENNKSALRPESESILAAVAGVLKEHPEIKKVRVEGHTDNKGRAAKNRVLSQARVDVVVKWLSAHGIDKARLVAKGFGQDHPIADNKTEEGRSRNRRVQFVILEKASPGS